jgi:murein DD-endopeptidase MepM/ murein hydrolase activator NlpD
VSGHHSGVDIGVDLGTPVGAAANGRVAFAGALSERGNMVILDHGMGVFTGYAHLSAILVRVGDMAATSSILGRAGSTGLSTGPHVHWECAVNGVNVDASLWTRIVLP